MFQLGKKLSTNILFNSKILNMNSLERVMTNNKIAEDMIISLKREFTTLKNEKTLIKIADLKRENDELKKQVEVAKTQLIQLETAHGKKQIQVPVPGEAVKKPEEKQSIVEKSEVTEAKAAKERKPKPDKSGSAAQQPTTAEAHIDIGRLDLRIGKIVEVSKHPDADALYLEKIDCGEAVPRTVISGLVKFVPIEEMQNRMVVVMCNLKPVKMRGITSEAMVMCASSPDKVEVLSPPVSAVPGDLVHCDKYPRVPDAVLNPKKKIFETVAPDLLTNDDLVACYKGSPLLVPGKGTITAQTLKNVHVK
jgi:aminoacyl tRNA synthase complex-interacting multifunctional protein 1